MHRTGLCPRGQEDDAVRWIAIRHGPDHIHLVAMLARQDRTRPRVVNERYRVRDACIAAEQRYGLRSTAPADRTAARRPTRAETGKAARHGRGEPPRTTLRRHVSTAAASAASTGEFFARLDHVGVLVRLRHSVTTPGQVTGYAVALPGDTTKTGEPVWYGGGKLAADLSWPRLCQRWTRPARPDPPLSAAETDAMWEYAARTTADATARIRFYTATSNPAAAADAASAASDALHVAAAALGSRALRSAADDYDRAARQPYGQIPAPTPAGNQLRHAARIISAYAYLTGDRALTPVVLSSASPPWPKPSPDSASPSSAPPRPPPLSAPPATFAPPPGQARPATGHQAGPPRPPRHPHPNPRGPVRPAPPGSLSSASPPRPVPAGPHQASPDPHPATRPRHAGRRHHGHAAPPASTAKVHSSACGRYGVLPCRKLSRACGWVPMQPSQPWPDNGPAPRSGSSPACPGRQAPPQPPDGKSAPRVRKI